MPDYSKNRVLALYKILINYTDEQHQISMQDILGYMEAGAFLQRRQHSAIYKTIKE